jgi:chromosome segregation ATPase
LFVSLLCQFHATINSLKDEIATLESEKLRLFKLQKANIAGRNATTGGAFGSTASNKNATNASIAAEEKIKKELREKAKLLEDKLKELKQKELEYSRVMSQKEKAIKEVCIHHYYYSYPIRFFK